jgi:hypothetical protein
LQAAQRRVKLANAFFPAAILASILAAAPRERGPPVSFNPPATPSTHRWPMIAHQRVIRDRLAAIEGEPAGINPALDAARVRPIGYKDAEAVILRYEWLGTMPAVSIYQFGIFFDGVCGGVVVFSPGSAARLLAELALIDTDQALKDRGLAVTRFVDDFRIFLTASDNTYDALGFLAEQLGINEGLSLNSTKTAIIPRRDYIHELDNMTTDLEEEAEGIALDTLTTNLYFDEEEPDEEDLEKLKGLNLVGMLETEIEKEYWDIGRIPGFISCPQDCKAYRRHRIHKRPLRGATGIWKRALLVDGGARRRVAGLLSGDARRDRRLDPDCACI